MSRKSFNEHIGSGKGFHEPGISIVECRVKKKIHLDQDDVDDHSVCALSAPTSA